MISLLRGLWYSRSGRWGLVLLGLLVGVAVAAPWLAPLGPEVQGDPLGSLSRPPATRLVVVKLDDNSRLLADWVERHDDELAVHRRSRVDRIDVARVLNLTADGVPDRALFLLGSDRLGRDIWARTAYGTRTALLVGALAALLSLSLGVMVGGAAALGGRTIDVVLMRAVDGLLAIPGLVLVIVLSAFFRPSPAMLILLIGCTSWMGASRLTRAEILSLKERDFILAARALGQAPRRVFFRHLLPNALTPLLVDTSLRVGATILVEAALSFLGLGIPARVPSWGGMIAHGRADLASLWWATTFPGLAIIITVVAFNLLADGLRDALDPRLATR